MAKPEQETEVQRPLEIRQEGDRVWIEGICYDASVFKMFADPPTGRWYSFRRDDELLVMQDVTDTIYDDVLSAYRENLMNVRLHNEDLQRQFETSMILANRYKGRFTRLKELVKQENDVAIEEYLQTIHDEERAADVV